MGYRNDRYPHRRRLQWWPPELGIIVGRRDQFRVLPIQSVWLDKLLYQRGLVATKCWARREGYSCDTTDTLPSRAPAIGLPHRMGQRVECVRLCASMVLYFIFRDLPLTKVVVSVKRVRLRRRHGSVQWRLLWDQHRSREWSLRRYCGLALTHFQINEQIAKQGYRLAAWLNVIVTGSTGLWDNRVFVSWGWLLRGHGFFERKKSPRCATFEIGIFFNVRILLRKGCSGVKSQ